MSVSDPPNVFRRRFRARADPHCSAAELEDDFHHMIARINHDGSKITAVSGHMARNPYDVCVGAIAILQSLVGLPISSREVLPPEFASKEHCTHLLDAAQLAIAQAARGGERRYEFRVPDLIGFRTEPSVLRDGKEVLQFEIENDLILAPVLFAGQSFRTILPWAQRNLDDDQLEAVRLLRRVLLVAQGWQSSGRDRVAPRDIPDARLDACFTLRRPRIDHAIPQDNHRPLSEFPELFTVQG